MLGPGCKSMPTGVNERSFYANLPPPSVNYSQWSAWSDKIWSAPRIRVDKISKVWRFEGGISLSNSTSHHGLSIADMLPFFAHDITDHEGVTRRRGRWDNECLCPVRLPPTNLWTEFQIASTPASGPHHPLLSPHLLYFGPWMQRGGRGFSKVITSSLTLNKFSQFKKRNFKWISQNRPSCYVPIKFA